MGMDLEKQIRTFMRLKLEHNCFSMMEGIYFHLTFVWKGVSINCAWKGVGVPGSYWHPLPILILSAPQIIIMTSDHKCKQTGDVHFGGHLEVG